MSHALQSFQNLGDVVTATKTHERIKVIMNPVSGDIMARDEPKSAKGGSMIGALITQISTVTKYVLHGEP